MHTHRFGHSVTRLEEDGSLLVFGGTDGRGMLFNDLYRYVVHAVAGQTDR